MVWLEQLQTWMLTPLFSIGGQDVSVSTIGVCLIIFIVSLIVSAIVQRLLSTHLFSRLNIQPGAAYVIRRIVHYIIVALGLAIALSTAQINLSALAIVLGFLSVGIGFGLQNITSNFISGLILLIERPVSVGDYVRVGDEVGTVLDIKMRSTLINTQDNVTIIVPNSQLIEHEVVNWSHGDTRVRIHAPIGVAYGSNMQAVRVALEKVAAEHPSVLKDPAPEVRFLKFGDSSLNMDLLVWINRPQDQFLILSQLNFAIDAAFRAANVTIPFPQRDLRLQPSPAIDRLSHRHS
jgi:small-conductance mechanosensitive channel